MKTIINCPYCGHNNAFTYIAGWNNKEKIVFTCDFETGGCDKDFVLITWAEVKTLIKEIK